MLSPEWTQQLLQHFEQRTAETEDLIRILGAALDVVPVTQVRLGYQWLPSKEALDTIAYAKDRLNEFRISPPTDRPGGG